MPTRRLAVAAILAFGACTRPIPGVLTLAPAGMRTTGACIPHPDGTLSLPAGATADSTIYADAGGVTITVSAKLPSLEYRPTIEVWFAGDRVGSVRVEAAAARAFPFHAHARTSGPASLRVVVPLPSDGATPTGVVLDLIKVVITEP